MFLSAFDQFLALGRHDFILSPVSVFVRPIYTRNRQSYLRKL